MRTARRLRLMVIVTVIWGIASFLGSSSVYASQLAAIQEELSQVVKKVTPAVVNISITNKVRPQPPGEFEREFPFPEEWKDFFKQFPQMPKKYFREWKKGPFQFKEWRWKSPPAPPQRGLGSGIIVDKRGYILTNNHVIADAQKIFVTLAERKKFEAKVVGKDPATDLAVIKIEPDRNLPVALLGDSDKVEVGDLVLAIGNPMGLERSVTFGIVSAKGRNVGLANYEDYIQTDAAITFGNSGGPLVNIDGKVIGINTAIMGVGQNIGFAIPINTAKKVLSDLIKHGEVLRPWIGITIQDVTEELAPQVGVQAGEGVLISQVVKGSPGEKAGLQTGDVVLKIDGKTVDSAHSLQKEVLARNIGDKINLLILREGKKLNISLILAKMPSGILEPEAGEKEWRGMTIQEITADLAETLELPDTRGVLVSNVAGGSPADEAGIKVQDVILRVGKKQIESPNDFWEAVKGIKDSENALLLIRREGRSRFVVVKGEK